jgi:hypothetical protein
MNQGLLIWERMILESLSKGQKRLNELCDDTLIGFNMVKNILDNLVQEKFILEEAGIYKINREVNFEEEAIKEEVKDLFTSLVGLYYKNKSQIKLKKIFLTPAEFETFKMQLFTLEGFLEKISKEERDIRLHEQRIIMWGHAPYAHLLEDI